MWIWTPQRVIGCIYNLHGWLEAWVNTCVNSSKQCQSGDFHSGCVLSRHATHSKAAGFEVRPGGSPRAHWLWWGKNWAPPLFEASLISENTGLSSPGVACFSSNKEHHGKWVILSWCLKVFQLCLSIWPGCGTPAHFLIPLPIYFDFFLYFFFLIN